MAPAGNVNKKERMFVIFIDSRRQLRYVGCHRAPHRHAVGGLDIPSAL